MQQSKMDLISRARRRNFRDPTRSQLAQWMYLPEDCQAIVQTSLRLEDADGNTTKLFQRWSRIRYAKFARSRRVDKELDGTKCQETDPLLASGLVSLIASISGTRSEQ